MPADCENLRQNARDWRLLVVFGAGASLADSKDREIELLLQMDIRREEAEAMDVKVQEWGVLATLALIFSPTIGTALGKVLGVDLFWQSFFELPGSN